VFALYPGSQAAAASDPRAVVTSGGDIVVVRKTKDEMRSDLEEAQARQALVNLEEALIRLDHQLAGAQADLEVAKRNAAGEGLRPDQVKAFQHLVMSSQARVDNAKRAKQNLQIVIDVRSGKNEAEREPEPEPEPEPEVQETQPEDSSGEKAPAGTDEDEERQLAAATLIQDAVKDTDVLSDGD
jgi:hypothetical protein